MSTYSIHSPISRRRPSESTVALRTSTVAIIAVCVMAALIAVAFLAAAPATTTQVKHIGHAAMIASASDGTILVASNGAVPAPAAKTATHVRPWRETLHGRAMGIGRAPASVLLRPTVSGQ